jgi:peptide/nickel transport system substrate-binding protein
VRRTYTAPVCALLLTFAVAACSKGGGGSSAQGGARSNSWTVPHVLRYATAADVNGLNPWFTQQISTLLMAQLTMAWLVKYDEHNMPYAELATQVPTKSNGGVSPDGLTITYHIRKGVRWSDGAAFNADDVVYSFDQMLNTANNVTSRAGYDHITKVDEPDKYTVVLHLNKPYSPFVETFFATAGANPCILPKHLLAKYPNLNNVPYNALPVGIGPFKYKEWQRASKVVMVANPLYWRGAPKLKEIDFEIIPDRNTVLTTMQAKALDLWIPVPGSYYARAAAIPGFRGLSHASYAFNHLDFNTTHPAVSDPQVRLALEYAMDRPTLVKKIYHGVADLVEEPASPVAPYFDPNIKLRAFDIAKANQILDAAGWKMGPDGIRAKNGVKLMIDFATSSGSPDTDELIELIRESWKQIGAGIQVHHYTAPVLFNSYQDGGVIYGGKFDVVLFAWYLDAVGDFSTEYACDQIPPAGQNDPHWCNQRATQAMHALYGHYSQAKRNADDTIVMTQMEKDVPFIVTTHPRDNFVFNSDLEGFHPNQVSLFDNMMNVDI